MPEEEGKQVVENERRPTGELQNVYVTGTPFLASLEWARHFDSCGRAEPSTYAKWVTASSLSRGI